MAEVDTPRALLVMAVQDLHDGETAMVERLDDIRSCLSDEEMLELVDLDAGRSADQRWELAKIACAMDAEPYEADNVWLRAILDDAENDCAAIAKGPLRDIALAGALRKAKQSQRVSYITVLTLARTLGNAEAAASLTRMAEAAERTDLALADALERLCGGLWGRETAPRCATSKSSA